MTKIRYKYVKDTVNSLFIKLKISSYPIDIVNIFSSFKNCRLVSYSKQMRKYKLTEIEVIDYFGSDEGCTIYNAKKNRYLVFYNDLDIHYKTPPRRRWTIAHELGHILLNHLTISNKLIIFRNNLADEEYEWLEAEANRFASLLLANPLILHELNIKNNYDIISICKLSDEASQYRFNEYLKWSKHKYIDRYDHMVVKQFYDFIYKKQCLQCGHTFISESSKYCPICGYNEIVWGDAEMKYNDGVELDERSHANVCPRCGNEDVDPFAMYCKICGAYLFQECTDNTDTDWNGNEYISEKGCGNESLPSNARFCPLCAHETTFYKYGYLKKWQDEKAEIEEMMKYQTVNEEIASSSDSDDEIPF